ncbi:uncharacterized protein LOC127783674 [Oryza glaberrima]|nr:uncharacterized protein LOC127783674 [Oryza glaberrima]
MIFAVNMCASATKSRVLHFEKFLVGAGVDSLEKYQNSRFVFAWKLLQPLPLRLRSEMDEHQSGNFKIQDIKDCTAVTSAEAARQFFTAQLEDIRMKKGTRKEKGTRQKNDAAAAKDERAIEVGASSSVEAVAAQVQAAEETKAIPQGLLAHDAKE